MEEFALCFAVYVCGYIYMAIQIAYDSFIPSLTLVNATDLKTLFPNKVLRTVNRQHGRLHTDAFLQGCNKWGCNGERGT